MVLRASIFILIGLVSWVSQATVTVISVKKTSYSAATGAIFGDPQTTVTTVYGGYSGDPCIGVDSTTTCDSCASIDENTVNIPACNSKRIYDTLSLEVTIRIESTGTETGKIFVAPDLAVEAGAQTPIHEPTNLQNVGPGTYAVQIPWSKLCNYLNGSGSAGCTGDIPSTAKAIRIGIDNIPTDNVLDDYTSDLRVAVAKLSNDANGGENELCDSASTSINGVCNFITYPGDQKAYIENVRGNCSLPSLTGALDAKAIRVYYQEASVGSIPNQKSGQYVDLNLNTENNSCVSGSNTKFVGLVSNEVTNLKNDTDYVFSIGIIDIANNVGLVTNDGSLAVGDNSRCYDATESPDRNCHRVTPSEVAGLLTDELDCFITTAAYGSPFKAKVQTFRQFRNRFLKTNSLGRLIINTYYKVSPPMARWMDQHPNSKPVVRIILWPLWFVATLALHWPLAMTLFILGALVIFLRPRRHGREL